MPPCLPRSETGLGKCSSIRCSLAAWFARPTRRTRRRTDEERIVSRHKRFRSRHGHLAPRNGKVLKRTKVAPIKLPGTVSAQVYFQQGGAKLTTTRRPDTLIFRPPPTHSVMVLFMIPMATRRRSGCRRETVVTAPDDDGIMRTARLTTERGHQRKGDSRCRRGVFEDDISDIGRVFRSFRG